MKKLYWIINQLNNDDSSISQIEIASKLVQYRSISLIVLGSKEDSILNVSGKIDIIYLDIDKKYYEDDILTSYFKANKNKLKNRISELTTKNDIIISTSYLSSYIVPKGRRFLYYYLGTKDSFLKITEKIRRRSYRTPDNYIFSSVTLKEFLDKKKKYRGSYQLYPCQSLYPSLDLSPKNNKMMYVYQNKDNYLLPLIILNKLKELGINSTLDYYANDEIISKVKGYVVENGLTKQVNFISEFEMQSAFKQVDFVIYINNKNAIPLFIIEALSQSKIVICNKNEAIDEGTSITIDEKNISSTILELKDLINKSKRLEKYKQNSFNYSFRYSKDMIIAKWLDVLDNEDNLLHKE